MLCDKSRQCWHVRNRGSACFDVTVNRLLFVQEGPVISFNAATTLHNFCLWQQTQNVLDDAHPAHHDTAVLITRCGCRSGPSLVAALLPCMLTPPPLPELFVSDTWKCSRRTCITKDTLKWKPFLLFFFLYQNTSWFLRKLAMLGC